MAQSLREGSIYLPASQLNLSYLEWGKADHRPSILALHGWLDNAATFCTLIPELADRHWIALDLPGHGRSQHKPIGSGYFFTDYVFHLREIEAALQLQRYHLLGHSLGSGICSLYASLYSDQLTSVGFIEGLGPLPGHDEEAFRRLKSHMEKRWNLGSRPLTRYKSVDEALKVRLKASPMAEAGARAIVERGLRRDGDAYVWTTDQRLTLPAPMRYPESHVQAILSHIQCPAVFIKARDGILKDGGTFDISARESMIPHLQIHELPGQHHLHIDNPKGVAAIMRDFWSAAET